MIECLMIICVVLLVFIVNIYWLCLYRIKKENMVLDAKIVELEDSLHKFTDKISNSEIKTNNLEKELQKFKDNLFNNERKIDNVEEELQNFTDTLVNKLKASL